MLYEKCIARSRVLQLRVTCSAVDEYKEPPFLHDGVMQHGPIA
jgi:hypothetical protein